MLVVIPRIPALLAGSAQVEFGFLPGTGVRIQMRRTKEHVIAPRPEKGAGCLAYHRRDAGGIAGCQAEHVNLVEWISRLAFALKNQRFAVRRKVPFPAAPSFENELPGVGEKEPFPGGTGFGLLHRTDACERKQ